MRFLAMVFLLLCYSCGSSPNVNFSVPKRLLHIHVHQFPDSPMKEPGYPNPSDPIPETELYVAGVSDQSVNKIAEGIAAVVIALLALAAHYIYNLRKALRVTAHSIEETPNSKPVRENIRDNSEGLLISKLIHKFAKEAEATIARRRKVYEQDEEFTWVW